MSSTTSNGDAGQKASSRFPPRRKEWNTETLFSVGLLFLASLNILVNHWALHTSNGDARGLLLDFQQQSTYREHDVATSRKRPTFTQQFTPSDHELSFTTSEEGSSLAAPAASSSSVAVFYNVYIPPDKGDSGIQNAIRIVKEQIGQVGRSYAATVVDPGLTVYYNTIGQDGALNATFMEDLCWKQHHVRCQHIRHYQEAFEEVTINEAYQFCQEHPTDRVIYLHSKGSYNPRPSQEQWRYFMTEAVTSQHCLQPPPPQQRDAQGCNICGLQFFPLWTMMYPGNEWMAHCDYLNRLVPPLEFEERLHSVLKEASQWHFYYGIYSSQDVHIGGGRYALEHWLASHPTVVPCDVSKDLHNVNDWQYRDDRSVEAFDWGLAPRFSIESTKFQTNQSPRRFSVLQDEALRKREYYLLAGNLFRWQSLYNEFPPLSSWVYSWFPDGDMWKEAVARYGDKAVQTVVGPRPKANVAKS